MVWATSDPNFPSRQSKVEYSKAYEECTVRDDYRTCATIKSMEMMVYEPVCGTNGCPANVTAQERGAVVLFHGGGFAGGSYCGCLTDTASKFFASRGLTAVVVGYRLDRGQGLSGAGVAFPADYVNEHVPLETPPRDLKLSAMYAAIRDTRAAVRYVRAAMGYEWIAVGGFSAGSAAALTHAVLSNAEFDSDYRDEVEDPLISTTHPNVSNAVSAGAPIVACRVEGVDALESLNVRNRWTSGRKPPILLSHELYDPVNPVENGQWVLDSSGYNGTVLTDFTPGKEHLPKGLGHQRSLLAALQLYGQHAGLELRATGGDTHEQTALPAEFVPSSCKKRPNKDALCSFVDGKCTGGEHSPSFYRHLFKSKCLPVHPNVVIAAAALVLAGCFCCYFRRRRQYCRTAPDQQQTPPPKSNHNRPLGHQSRKEVCSRLLSGGKIMRPTTLRPRCEEAIDKIMPED